MNIKVFLLMSKICSRKIKIYVEFIKMTTENPAENFIVKSWMEI